MSTKLTPASALLPGRRRGWGDHADAAHASRLFIAGLAMLAAIYAAWPIWRALFPMEISGNEAWNAFHAEIARVGGALYPEAQALTGNNYPPLSFHLIGMLAALSGFDPIYIGRFLSLIAVAITALCTMACVRVFGGTRTGAAVAGLWFLATMFRFFDGYVGMNDPHLPALAIMLLALAWILRRLNRHRGAEPAILLMVVAGFYKHNLIATPVTALIWLGSSDWRLGLRAAVIGAAASASGLVTCVVLYGDAFLHQMMMPRVYSGWASLADAGQLQWIAPALVIWAASAWNDRQDPSMRFSAIYIATSLVAYFLQKLGAGIGVNAQFELVTATAIGLGFAWSRSFAFPFQRFLGLNRVLLVCMLILIARLLLSTRMEAYLVLASSEYREQFGRMAEIVTREVDRVRSMPGPAHCSVMTVCMRAGKSFIYDAFVLDQRLKEGHLSNEALRAKLDDADIRFIEIDPRTRSTWLHRRL